MFLNFIFMLIFQEVIFHNDFWIIINLNDCDDENEIMI
jgi:hypothetical protein